MVISEIRRWNLQIVKLVRSVIVEEESYTSATGELRKRNIEPPDIFRRIDVREVNTSRSEFGQLSVWRSERLLRLCS
jgi:hypothetical protein